VIAVAYKLIENVGFLKLMKLRRAEVESNLSFLGFIIFENKIKEGTCQAIKILNKANIRQVMVTVYFFLTRIGR
jgi:cation-transporting ATPase 13A2